MPDKIKRLCPICRGEEIELTPYHSGCLSIKASPLTMVEEYLETEVYVCPRCRYAAFFTPPTAAEEQQARRLELRMNQYPADKLRHMAADPALTEEERAAAARVLSRRQG